MIRSYKVIIGIGVALLALVIFLEAKETSPLNWYKSYAKTSKIPYGTSVLHQLLKTEATAQGFEELNSPPFLILADSRNMLNGTYLFINSGVVFDEAESNKILEWVDKGNTLFVAGKSISKTILDTLHLGIDKYRELSNFEHKPEVSLTHQELKTASPYSLDIEVSTAYFSEIDTLNTKVLGTYDLQRTDTLDTKAVKVNFIKQDFGQGEIILHLFPEAYTNYFVLKENNKTYTEGALSYIPKTNTIYWDNHYKNGKVVYSSPLYILLNNRYLKWAYYMLILGTILWVFFEGKRKQRAVPIVTPLPNQTLAFTKTIAGMYLEKKDHTSIAIHSVNHFMHWLRSEQKVQTDIKGLAFIEHTAAKTGNTQEDTKKLIDYITNIQQVKVVTAAQLLQLNTLIEQFKDQTSYGRA